MKHETRLLTTGHIVDIFDDVFDYSECNNFNLFCQSTGYYCTNSSPLAEHNTNGGMASHLNDIDLEYFGFFKSYNIKPIMDKLGDRQRFKSWITLFKYMPDVYYHIDNDELTSKTLLYYCNIVWEPNYGGETIICKIGRAHV